MESKNLTTNGHVTDLASNFENREYFGPLCPRNILVTSASESTTIEPHQDRLDLKSNSRCGSQCSLYSEGGESFESYEAISSNRSLSADLSPSPSYSYSNPMKRRSINEVKNIPEIRPDIDNNNSYRNRSNTVCLPSTYNRRQALRVSNGSINGRRALSGVRNGSKLIEDNSNPLQSRPLLTANRPYEFDYHQQVAKKVHTEQVMPKHTLKGKLSKFQRLIDKAFDLIKTGDENNIIEGARMVAKIMINAWMSPKIGRDLAYGICDYLRKMGHLDTLLNLYLNDSTIPSIRQASGRVLEECLSAPNRHYLAASGNKLERLIEVVKEFKDGEPQRVAVSILEDIFKDSPQTNKRLVDLSALDYILNACQATCSSCSNSTDNARTFRHAAQALANLVMNSDHECQQRLIDKNVPDWLFLLASSQDDVTRYYACLAVCALVANKEIEAAVIKSGTLTLVEPFLLAHDPLNFATFDYKHCQGRPSEWLAKLVPILNAKRSEPRSMAAFHLAMEAGIKKDQELLSVFEEIGAVDALKQVASLPEEVAPKFASLALEIIGEQVPYKLSQQVALWSVTDVKYWVTQIGFESYASLFFKQKVDGDLLLLLTDDELERDIRMTSSLMRKRFMRELDSLKIAADYSCLDEMNMDRFLASIDPRFSIYTYKLLELGIDCSILASLGDEVLKSECGIANAVHRTKLIQSIQGCKDMEDIELAILSKQIDVFISYRRSTGSQLASLLKVLLQLRGYKVFIDIDRLYAGKFDCSLLKNIQAAKHFVLVLTPQALDRCLDDYENTDWVHREISCAVQYNKNIIPIFDPEFEWPDENRLPLDIKAITRFNGVRWVHEYQEACIAKLEKFIAGEINVNILTTQQKIKTTFNNRSPVRSCLGPTNNDLDIDEYSSAWPSRSRRNTNEFQTPPIILKMSTKTY